MQSTLGLSCKARGIAKCTVTLGRFGSLLENHHMSQQSHHEYLSWRNENLGSHKNLCMFITAMVVISKTCEPWKCLSVRGWMDKLARHSIGYSSAMEGKPRGIVLSEVSQSQEAAEYVMPSVGHSCSEREQISGCWGRIGGCDEGERRGAFGIVAWLVTWSRWWPVCPCVNVCKTTLTCPPSGKVQCAVY